MKQKILFLEDIVCGTHLDSPAWRVKRDELIAFASQWDPLPQHIDPSFAGELGVTAPGIYILAIKIALVHLLPQNPAVIASLGFDELRFCLPVRPGDELKLDLEWLETRASRSKPDRGVVKIRYKLLNQAKAVVMSHIDTILVWRRNRDEAKAVGKSTQ